MKTNITIYAEKFYIQQADGSYKLESSWGKGNPNWTEQHLDTSQ